jgi:hypothetical protein
MFMADYEFIAILFFLCLNHEQWFVLSEHDRLFTFYHSVILPDVHSKTVTYAGNIVNGFAV